MKLTSDEFRIPLRTVLLSYSYANCSLTKYMDRHKIKPDSKAFNLVQLNKIRYFFFASTVCLDSDNNLAVLASKTVNDGSQ